MSDISDLLTKNQTLCLISDRLSAENAILRADLAAVTEERDRMREAFEKAANDMHPMLRSMISRNEAAEIVRRAARAAIEGVTEKSGVENE